MTCGFFDTVPVQQYEASVIAGGTEHDVAGKIVVSGNDRADETALTEFCELYRLIRRGVGHDGADGAEGLHVVHGAALEGFVT